jgi:hypothetical protein
MNYWSLLELVWIIEACFNLYESWKFILTCMNYLSLFCVEPSRQRWFYAGRLLSDKIRIEDAKIPKNYVIQVIVAPEPTES